MLDRLSSKGQVVIPKPIREALRLAAGTRFDLQLHEGKIVLEPLPESTFEALYGKYADSDLLTGLEENHQHHVIEEDC
jgi:AbrB family looped-hinge helix DNA binding protein